MKILHTYALRYEIDEQCLSPKLVREKNFIRSVGFKLSNGEHVFKQWKAQKISETFDVKTFRLSTPAEHIMKWASMWYYQRILYSYRFGLKVGFSILGSNIWVDDKRIRFNFLASKRFLPSDLQHTRRLESVHRNFGCCQEIISTVFARASRHR